MKFTTSDNRVALSALIAIATMVLSARADPLSDAIERTIQPYVGAGNFAGAVLVAREGDIVFDKAYGEADSERHVANATSTSFHIGPLSAAYTAAVAMHLVEKGALSLDNTVGQFLPGIANGDRITVRDLLEGKSGLPDTAAGEENSAYRLLARIVALRAGTSFGEALNGFIFAPSWMEGAGVDDDTLEPARRYARGYVEGADGLKPVASIRWSDRMGDGSMYTTTRDELRFVQDVFGNGLLRAETRASMFDQPHCERCYGWIREDDKTTGRAYVASGEAPGFSAFVMHVPASNATVILLGNIQSSQTATLGRAVAAAAQSGF